VVIIIVVVIMLLLQQLGVAAALEKIARDANIVLKQPMSGTFAV
jgi:hypothetical protein